MIIDDLKNFDLYVGLNENFKIISDFLKDNDISSMDIGRYNINNNIYINIEEYETKEKSFPEAHRKYIDIQTVLSGCEYIGYTNLKNGKTQIEYNENKDIEFFNADCEFIKAEEGRFFILYPQDIHQPSMNYLKKSNVKKAVFKIKL